VTEPVWVPESAVMAIHDQQLAEHGGLNGIRDLGTIQSALARPINLWHYGANPDIPAMAAAYAYGLATTQGFMDGNKRTALVVAETFLNLNGFLLNTDDDLEIVRVMLAVATDLMSELDLADWFRSLTGR
jgi:death on curing protein